MEFIAELEVTVRITARDLIRAKAVLEEKQGYMVGGGRTDKAKEYFIREMRDERKVVSGPTATDMGDVHQDAAAVIRKYTDIHLLDSTKFGMEVHKPGDKKVRVSETLSDQEVLQGVPEPEDVDYPIDISPISPIKELKPKSRFTRKA